MTDTMKAEIRILERRKQGQHRWLKFSFIFNVKKKWATDFKQDRTSVPAWKVIHVTDIQKHLEPQKLLKTSMIWYLMITELKCIIFVRLYGFQKNVWDPIYMMNCICKSFVLGG